MIMKMKEIRDEISKIVKKILDLIKSHPEINANNVSSEVGQSLNEVILLLTNNMSLSSNIDDDFGFKAFKIFINILQKHKRITLFEFTNSNIVQTLLNFLLDGCIKPKKIQNQEESKLGEKNEKIKEEIKINNEQVSLILKRIFIFANCFSAKSPIRSQGF